MPPPGSCLMAERVRAEEREAGKNHDENDTGAAHANEKFPGVYTPPTIFHRTP